MALPPGGVPEWPKGTGCKPVGSAFRGSNPLSPTFRMPGFWNGRQQRKDALEWLSALLAQLVEHLHGKEGVDGSSPSEGLKKSPANRHVVLPAVAGFRCFVGTRRVHFGTGGHSRAHATSRDTARRAGGHAIA